ncbi:MAG: S-adenosylmethionine:tRNA ribosyltransferase-isomerase [Bacteroidales bacterium]|nr:S-adenosylmethionine:tRNA ribosyltransferase-isomerase [Bacteroidales bacterium]MDD3910757.1 S-adenosylmethionine:tRNA ribosyltransferase-isomerase [Bacteroidales bacterium]
MRPKIKIVDFTYSLPEERIAKYPLAERDSSKLLVFRKDKISDDNFYNINKYLPENSFMVFNNTKVVPARLYFRKITGAVIEILCLNPTAPKDYVMSFASVGSCEWNVVLGNAKRWKEGDIRFIADNTGSASIADSASNADDNIYRYAKTVNLRAELIKKGDEKGSIVRFKWDTNATFSEVLDICGQVPIPPYLNRKTEAIDKTRYQTIYAKIEGSVAAPTAGLHFTERVLKSLDNKGIKRDNVCLHVGAGTFIPVKSEFIADHHMHTEPFSVSRQFLADLAALRPGEKVISVGTTTTRTLESLYFIGVQCIEAGISLKYIRSLKGFSPEIVGQWTPYDKEYSYTLKEAIEAIIRYLDDNNLQRLVAGTSIIIVPGYKFHVIDIQITNFHQPQSTLLLLIAAIVGDGWKYAYQHALENGYRFLSYGDSCLLFRE